MTTHRRLAAQAAPAREGVDASTTHPIERDALDDLRAKLKIAMPGSLILVYAPTALDADRVATIGGNLFAFDRREAMDQDPRLWPVVTVDATFTHDGNLDLKWVMSSIQAEIGAPPKDVALPPSARAADRDAWRRRRRLQWREFADFLFGAVDACVGRDTELVVIRHLERRGDRTPQVAPGFGTEFLVQFAAAAKVKLVLSGGFEVLEYRTVAAPCLDVPIGRYNPAVAEDRTAFAAVASEELARLGCADIAGSEDGLDDLMTVSLGSVEALRQWVARAVELRPDRPDVAPEDLLGEAAIVAPHALKAAAERIVKAEQKLARERDVTLGDVFALLTQSTRAEHSQGAAKVVELRDQAAVGESRDLRPGERRLEDDPVGEGESDAA